MASPLWNLWLLSPSFPPCSLCLPILPSCWAWKSPISFYSSHFGHLSAVWQAARFTFSLKAVTHRRVALFVTTLKCKKMTVSQRAHQAWMMSNVGSHIYLTEEYGRGWWDKTVRHVCCLSLITKLERFSRECCSLLAASHFPCLFFFPLIRAWTTLCWIIIIILCSTYFGALQLVVNEKCKTLARVSTCLFMETVSLDHQSSFSLILAWDDT